MEVCVTKEGNLGGEVGTWDTEDVWRGVFEECGKV